MATVEAEIVGGEVRAQALELVGQSRAIAIMDQKTYDLAVDDRGRLKSLVEQIEERFAEPIRKAHEAHKAVLALRNELRSPVEAALQERNKQLVAWTEELEDRRRLEEERLLEEARKAAEKLRQREIKVLKRKGYDEESIQAVADAPLRVASIEVGEQYQKSDAITDGVTWSCEVVDKLAFIKWVAKNARVAHQYLEVDQAEVNRLAKSQQSLLDIPGLRAVPKTVIRDKPKRRS